MRGQPVAPCERKTRFTAVTPLKTKTAEKTDKMLRSVLGSLPQPIRHTITFDNSSEFTLHHNMMKFLAIETFFRDPHSPWQRENHRKHQRHHQAGHALKNLAFHRHRPRYR